MEGITAMAKAYQDKGIGFVAISSNDVVNYPDDDPALMKETAEKYGFSFPYLYDESQSVAKEYDAACTPDFYLFDGGKTLVYRGQMDSSRPKNDFNGVIMSLTIYSAASCKRAANCHLISMLLLCNFNNSVTITLC